MKPLRVIKRNPKDPDWLFRYATRETMERILEYFRTRHLRPNNWKEAKETHVFGTSWQRKKLKPERWASVPIEHRDKVEEWFQKKLAAVPEGKRTQAKIRSLMGNAAFYGRSVLTHKICGRNLHFGGRRKLYRAWLAWTAEQQRKEELASRPPTRSKVLELA